MTTGSAQPADAAAREQPDSFAIRLPDPWIEVPTDPSEARRFRDQFLALASESLELRPPDRRQLELLLDGMTEELQREQVVLAAVFTDVDVDDDDADAPAEPSEAAGSDEDVRLQAATVTVSVRSYEEIGSEVPVGTAMLLAAMSLHDESEATELSPVDLEPPVEIDLPAGRAVLLHRLERSRLSQFAIAEVYAQTYLVPFDEGREVCILQFTTPLVADASDYRELFDLMADSFRMLYPSDPTDILTRAHPDQDGPD